MATQKLENSKFKEMMKEKAYRNPALADELAALFKRLLGELAPLADKCSSNSFQLSDHDLNFFTVRVEQLHQSLQRTCNKLAKKTKRLRNPVYRYTRVCSTSDFLAELEASARRADELLRDITAISVNATLIAQQTADVTVVVENHAGEVTAAIERETEALAAAIAAGSEAANKKDSFNPSFGVPENPPHVVLDFQPAALTEQGVARPCTIEARLKAVVLQSDGSQSIGAVGSALGHAVGTDGMSGVGKSCALRGLAQDAEVRQRFRDGIYYVILGKDATEASVVHQIAKVLKASDGPRIAKEVLEEECLEAAVSRARQWFTGKRSLLLLDDAWDKNDSGRNLVARLSSIVDIGEGSRVVFTTRDVRIRLRSQLIHFSARGPNVSLQILLASAGMLEQEIEAFRSTVKGVLDLCGGLPMALAVAGSAIRLQLALRSRYRLTSAEVWGTYLSEMQKHSEYLLHVTVDNDAYGNLSSAFMASLSMLDMNVSGILPFQPVKSFFEMYRGLIVLQRQGWIPVTVLENLWDTADEHETIRVLQGLVSANLALREDRLVNGRKTPGVSLHDLHLNFVQDECKKRGESKKWHRKLLGNYLPETDSKSSRESGKSRHWWKDEVFANEYIRNHVSRHLLGAGLEGELHSLLRDPRWAVKRLLSNEILRLEHDFRMIVELKQVGGFEVQRGSEPCSLNMIAGASRLSSPYVSRNPCEVWFQLCARLLRLSEQSEIIRMYVADIQRFAPKPWVRPLSACLPQPGSTLQSTVLCDGDVRWISQMEDDREIVACGITDDGVAFVSSVIAGHLDKTVFLSVNWDNADAAADDGTSAGSSSMRRVLSVGLTRDGTRAATGHVDGAVLLWDVETGELVGDGLYPVLNEIRSVLSVAFSADGKRVGWIAEDGTLRVRDVETGESIDALPGRNFVGGVALSADGSLVASGSRDSSVRVLDVKTGDLVGDALYGHSGYVSCVAFSTDGKRLVSGSTDTTVRVWDLETGVALGDALCGHSGSFGVVAFSADGTRVASGSWDGTVRVWNVETGQAEGNAFRHNKSVTCVALSADGRHVASGSDDKTLRVWEVGTGEALGEAFPEHSDEVFCVALSADGKRGASGSGDKTVRVWNMETGKAVGNTLSGHINSVTCVVLSADGKRVVSGSEDSTLRVWETETGEAVSEVLTGHGNFIYCVAMSADGTSFASGSMDKTVRVWDADTGKAVGGALRGHSSWVVCIALSPDGNRVTSGSLDGTARLWDVGSGNCLQTDDGWTYGDMRRLRFLLREDVSAERHQGDDIVSFESACVKYGSTHESSVLATLERYALWEYSEVGRSIIAGSANGIVDIFKLVV